MKVGPASDGEERQRATMPFDCLNTHHRRWAFGVFLWTYFIAADAFATCPIAVQPADANAAWTTAAHATEKRLADLRDAPQDCRSVTIEVQREGNALLTFTTVDGRIAARLLHTPEDVAPTLEALLVTWPVSPSLVLPETPSIPMPKPSAPAKEITRTVHQSTMYAPEKPILHSVVPRFVLGASAGIRCGVDEMIFAPALLLRGSFVLSSWEIGVRGEWNPTYSRIFGGDPGGFRMYSLAANLTIGRREKLRRFDFPYGFSMGLAGVHEDIDVNPTIRGDIGLDTFEPLAGAYIGLVMPREGRLRFSLGLAFDAALTGLKESATKVRGLPALPRFGIGLSIGMEVWP